MRSDLRFRYHKPPSDSFPNGVKWLLISNTAVFFLMVLLSQLGRSPMEPEGYAQKLYIFELLPKAVVYQFALWQLATYMFFHGGLGHIFFNMLTLYWFGPDLERTWGTKRFLKYYFVCGIGAGLCVVLAECVSGFTNMRTLGCSGAIYGLLLAYGLLFPDRIILFFFIIPMKVRHFVWIMGLLAFYFSITGGNPGVSNVAHLGGLGVGYAYLRIKFARLDGGLLVKRYQQWKLQRAKKKFQVYMRKHGGPGGTMLQ